MKTTTPKMQFTSDSTLSGLLEVIIAKSQGSSSFRKSGIELLRDQLGETSEMRNHRLKNTSDRDIEEWITILNRTTEMLEEVIGGNIVEGVKTINNLTKEMIELKVTGLFLAIGHTPNTEIFQGKIEMGKKMLHQIVFWCGQKVNQHP